MNFVEKRQNLPSGIRYQWSPPLLSTKTPRTLLWWEVGCQNVTLERCPEGRLTAEYRAILVTNTPIMRKRYNGEIGFALIKFLYNLRHPLGMISNWWSKYFILCGASPTLAASIISTAASSPLASPGLSTRSRILSKNLRKILNQKPLYDNKPLEVPQNPSET